MVSLPAASYSGYRRSSMVEPSGPCVLASVDTCTHYIEPHRAVTEADDLTGPRGARPQVPWAPGVYHAWQHKAGQSQAAHKGEAAQLGHVVLGQLQQRQRGVVHLLQGIMDAQLGPDGRGGVDDVRHAPARPSISRPLGATLAARRRSALLRSSWWRWGEVTQARLGPADPGPAASHPLAAGPPWPRTCGVPGG